MNQDPNAFEPGSNQNIEANADSTSSLLTVSQSYEYLIAKGLPRSKKTIRKWCRLGHVDQKQNVIPGGPKWLITRSSLDARIAEERLIDASLTQETGANRSEPVPVQTGANPSAPVRDDELVKVLKQQLTHERDARKATEEKNRELIGMYHEIAMASTQFGIEIGKGMQEQGKARQLGADSEPGPDRSPGAAPGVRTVRPEPRDDSSTTETGGDAGDNDTGGSYRLGYNGEHE